MRWKDSMTLRLIIRIILTMWFYFKTKDRIASAHKQDKLHQLILQKIILAIQILVIIDKASSIVASEDEFFLKNNQ